MRKKLTETLKRSFRPEFINRLDSVVVFRALNNEDIQKIAALELDKVADRLKEHDLTLEASDAALNLLADMGFDIEMGARPLRRVIQQQVEDPLSDQLLSGKFPDGSAIRVDVDDDGMIILTSKKKRARKAKAKETEPEPVA